ncbi:unnamed protein product [Ceratitis capitata]|uniref:(Mediterranean fruit fly) hypothetical protein n=1 Tax=Ceratitis capitata TaxID=7213 RepID=A0A811UV91_CERCA|nr:unnamed protein product [Ceratitis capitata]
MTRNPEELTESLNPIVGHVEYHRRFQGPIPTLDKSVMCIRAVCLRGHQPPRVAVDYSEAVSISLARWQGGKVETFYSETHKSKLEHAEWCGGCHLRYVSWFNENLMVTTSLTNFKYYQHNSGESTLRGHEGGEELYRFRSMDRRLGFAFMEAICLVITASYSMADCIQRGLRLYEQHNQNAAVRIWRSALKATNRREDCFQLLGYLYQAHMDWGKYREAIEFGHRQLGISEELDSPIMRTETYLNLARAHERLGGLERALSYARHSLYNDCGTQCRTGGIVHLTVARVYLEMGGFSRALEGLQGAHKIATSIGDPSLELQVYVTLSELFGRLQDNDKSAMYASKAYDLSRSLLLGDLNSSHHRAALLRMAASLRKQGDLGDAHDYCMEATRLALISGDQATYTRTLRVMGDIYRKKVDMDRAFRQYEEAMGTSAAVGDRMAQMEAMDGAARCLEALRLQQKICNCRPLEFNTRLLEVASSIGSKLLVRRIRSRLALIYRALGDEEQYKTQLRLAGQTDAALGLFCGACGETFGLEPDSIEALPCAHILHAR